MTLKRFKGPSGTLVVLEHVSSILRDNPLGDPHVRKVGVWLPPEYDYSGNKRYPVLYDLVGFTGFVADPFVHVRHIATHKEGSCPGSRWRIPRRRSQKRRSRSATASTLL